MILINQSIKPFYSELNNLVCKPQKFNNVLINPYFLKDYDEYHLMRKYFGLVTHVIPDIEITTMSYLKYLLYIHPDTIMYEHNKTYPATLITREQAIERVSNDIKQILRKCLSVADGNIVDIEFKETFRSSGKHRIYNYRDINVKIRLNLILHIEQHLHGRFGTKVQLSTIKIPDLDFNNIKDIILEQNGISTEQLKQYDTYLESRLAILNRNFNYLDFDEQVITFANYMRIHTSTVLEKYTFFLLSKYIQSEKTRIENITLTPLIISGQITLKKNETINHWLQHQPVAGRYDAILINKTEFIKNSDVFKGSK